MNAAVRSAYRTRYCDNGKRCLNNIVFQKKKKIYFKHHSIKHYFFKNYFCNFFTDFLI